MLLAGLAGLAGAILAAALRKNAVRSPREDWPVNLAHRGASTALPENTLEAFRAGIEAGAGGIELDVHVTRDGEVVVIHDATVERTTDGCGLISDMTMAQVRALDAGHCFSGDGGSFPNRNQRFRVPTLAEIYDDLPETPVNIEIKEARAGDEEIVFGLVRRAGAERRTIVAARRHGTIRRFRRVSRGQVPTAASLFEIGVFYLLSRLRLEWFSRPKYEALQIPEYHLGVALLTRRFVEAAHALGVRVDVWTVNEPDAMRRVLDLGADTIMTDRPDVLDRVLREGSLDHIREKSTSRSESTPRQV